MRQSSLYAAATLAMAALWAFTPAKAEYNYGPLKNGNQCFTSSPNHSGTNAATWGYWAACPATASVAAVAPRHHHRHRA